MKRSSEFTDSKISKRERLRQINWKNVRGMGKAALSLVGFGAVLAGHLYLFDSNSTQPGTRFNGSDQEWGSGKKEKVTQVIGSVTDTIGGVFEAHNPDGDTTYFTIGSDETNPDWSAPDQDVQPGATPELPDVDIIDNQDGAE